MKNPFERPHTEEEAVVEASKMKEKVGSKEVQNYSEAENAVEREKIHKKVSLITVSQVDLGIKTLAGVLKDKKDVKFDVEKFNLLKNDNEIGFTKEETSQLLDRLSDSDFIGISAVGYKFDEKVVPLIREIKRNLPDKPVILGGDHAIMNPEECWNTNVDAVCFGEGEIDLGFLLEHWKERFEPETRKKIKNFILEDKDLMEMKELARKRLGKDELDKYTPDLSFENLYVLKDGQLIEASTNNMPEAIQHQIPQNENVLVYAFMRGCPYSCEYCYYANLAEQWGKIFESKSIEKAVQELKFGKEEIEKEREEQRKKGESEGPDPFLVLMNSDTAAMSIKDLEKFRDLYREEINMPFYCMCSPSSLTPERIKILSDAGMVHLNIGIQTNEDSNRQFYSRKQSDEKIINLTKEVNNIRNKENKDLQIFCDFIIYNPFENRNDIRKTIELVKKMETPFDYVPHTLFLGPESKLRKRYEMEKTRKEKNGQEMDRLLEDNKEIGYSNFHDTYRFYPWLKNNKEFVINTLCEFMAGQHNDKQMGRIPRFVKDLVDWDVFDKTNIEKTILKESKKIIIDERREKYVKDKLKDYDNFKAFFSENLNKINGDQLSIDFLISNEILNYFDEHKNLFINIALTLKDLHPQHFSNEADGKRAYEEEFPDESVEPLF